ncbi:MAG: hypothetical protein QOD00_2412 [Blastocatellia bacterium]|jgi:hypothetical protein|nr:hypothetical protein [Blastocatellia bacterium]
MTKPRIFLSHSAKEPKAAEILRHLIADLEQEFKVLCDQERLGKEEDQLLAGQDWRAKLFYWMSQAQGAVIIFSERALASDWVRAESSILAWRRLMDRNQRFTLIPVLLDPVKRSDLEQKQFSPMRLTELELVRNQDAARISAKVREGLAHLLKGQPPETFIEKLERKIARLLRHVDEPELKSAAQSIGANIDEWGADTNPQMMLAAEMIRRGLSSAVRVLLELDVSLTREARRELIDLVAPTWVDLSAASGIPEIAAREGARRLLRVNGGLMGVEEFTGNSFIRRACGRSPDLAWAVLPIPNAAGEDAVGYYKHAIRKQLQSRVVKVENAKDPQIRSVLERKDRDQEPVFILFSPPLPDRAVLDELRREFPTLTFFLLTGDCTVSEQVRELSGGEFLQPELKAGEEQNAYDEYVYALTYA